MIFCSKKGTWLVALVVTAIIGPLFIGLFLLRLPGVNLWVAVGPPVVSIVIVVLMLVMSYPLYYEVTPSGLTIRCGFFVRRQIPLSSIKEVFPTKNALSAPAWSLDRLRINYEENGVDGSALISPKDKVSFMRELVRLTPGLEMQGECVVKV